MMLDVAILSPVCDACRHLTDFQKCAAYPAGIPVEIWNGRNQHTAPHPGDGGLLFERDPAATVVQSSRELAEFFDPRQPRDKDGKWTSGGTSGGAPAFIDEGEARMLHTRVIDEGGFTYEPVDNRSPDGGYVVSIYPEREFSRHVSEIDESVIEDYMIKNADLLEQENVMLGGWHDTETGLVYLDCSVVLPDRGEAVRLAREHSQEGIFDLNNFETIIAKSEQERRTAATGELAEFLSTFLGADSVRGVLAELEDETAVTAEDIERLLARWKRYWAENPIANIFDGQEIELYDPRQPRGKDGKWTTAGGFSGATPEKAIRAEMRGGQQVLPGKVGDKTALVERAASAQERAYREARTFDENGRFRDGLIIHKESGYDDYDEFITDFEEVAGMHPDEFADFANHSWGIDQGEHNSGLHTQFTDVSFDTYSGVEVKGIVLDADGNPAGTFKRYVTYGNVDHAYFALTPGNQGKGFGTEFYFNSERVYIDYGMSSITVHANISGGVGGYAWARMGFDFRHEGARESFAESINEAWHISARNEYRRLYRANPLGLGDRDAGVPSFDEFIEQKDYDLGAWSPYLDDSPAWEHAAAIYERNDGTIERIGKETMMGTNWYGIKDLYGDGVEAGEQYYASK